MFRGFAIRDAVIVLATIVVWMLSVRVSPGTTLATALSGAAGVGALICFHNFHEWSHLLGAMATDSVYAPAKRLISPFLFAYDEKENTKRQFIIMSLSGFAATGLGLTFFLLWMPRDQLGGQIARNGAIFLSALTVIFEFPIFFRALLGSTLPRTGVFTGPTVGGTKSSRGSAPREP